MIQFYLSVFVSKLVCECSPVPIFLVIAPPYVSVERNKMLLRRENDHHVRDFDMRRILPIKMFNSIN